MLLGRGDVFSEERLRQITSTWDMVQGRAVIDNTFESFMTRPNVVTFSIDYWRLVVS